MQNTFRIISLSVLLIIVAGCGTNKHSSNQKTTIYNDNAYTLKIKTDTLFNSQQRICLLAFHKNSLNQYTIDIAYNEVDLEKTSQMASNSNAFAAINGGFFNMDAGGSVTYFEINDSVIGKTRDPKLKWGVSDRIINGAIVFTKENKLKIESANTETFYAKSKKESFVLFTGPLLISNSKLQSLPDMGFANKRHPRTCLGITKDSIIFVTIDGRSKQASGMSLYQAQEYLLDMGSIDATHLDGGRTTTMWTKNKGLVSIPSDKNGERPVANALLILESHTQDSN